MCKFSFNFNNFKDRYRIDPIYGNQLQVDTTLDTKCKSQFYVIKSVLLNLRAFILFGCFTHFGIYLVLVAMMSLLFMIQN